MGYGLFANKTIYKEELDNLDLIAIANEFTRESDHRARFFAGDIPSEPVYILSFYLFSYCWWL